MIEYVISFLSSNYDIIHSNKNILDGHKTLFLGFSVRKISLEKTERILPMHTRVTVKRMGTVVPRTRDNEHKLEHRKLHLNMKKKLFYFKGDSTGIGCLERLWSLLP